jgi:hypothetical protein
MKIPSLSAAAVCAAFIVCGALAVPVPVPLLLKGAVQGDLPLKSIGVISFGPDGLLLVAEPGSASIVAIETGDKGPDVKVTPALNDVAATIATALQTTADKIQIVAMAVNPASGKVYFSVRDNGTNAVENRLGYPAGKNFSTRDNGTDAVALVSIEGGKAVRFDPAAHPHVRVTLPAAQAGPIRAISGLAIAGDRLLVTGQSNEEFSSKIFSIPLPLGPDSVGGIYSAETYHVSHGRWETKAPIQAFIPYDDHGQACVVGAFACTPIAKFPISDLASGANVRGTSVVELGSGNRPINLLSYTDASGKGWIVCNTNRFHQPLFGPSKYWGVRVSMAYLDRSAPDQTNEKAARRDVKQTSGPEGIEILDALSGAVQISKLNDRTMVVLRENGTKLDLASAPLP